MPLEQKQSCSGVTFVDIGVSLFVTSNGAVSILGLLPLGSCNVK